MDKKKEKQRKSGSKKKARAKSKVVKKNAARRSASSHEGRISALENDVKALKSVRGFKAGALAEAAGATTAVTFGWPPDGGGSSVKVDAARLKSNPTTLQLPPGKHELEWVIFGAPKTPYVVSVTGAQYPTSPIKGTLPDEGSETGFADVRV